APEPAHSRFSLFDGVTTFLQRLAARDAHVLVLDDLHWADDGTVLLLGHVIPEIRRSHLLIVCMYRDAEMRRTPRHLAQLARADGRVALGGLDGAECERVVAQTSSRPVSADLVGQLHRVSGGTPYSLGELVGWLRSRKGTTVDLTRQLPDEMCELTRQRLAP